MTRLLSFILLAGIIGGCTAGKKYDPGTYLSPHDQDKMMSAVIRLAAKLPKKADDSLKFDRKYDEYYDQQKASHILLGYYISEDNEHFFLIKRRAPSIHDRYVATGGRMRFGNNWELTEYEEVFRTWKLGKDTLESRALYLFDLMVKGEPLEPYYTKTAGFEYIEFPDDNVYYDKASRTWKSRAIRSVEELARENILSDSPNGSKDLRAE